MRRTSSSPMLIGLALLILIALFGYFGYQLYRQDKKIETIKTAVIDDGNKITSVVDFINASVSAQQTTK